MWLRLVWVLAAIGLLSACAGRQGSEPRPSMERSYELVGLNFSAKEGLVVSEDNGFYPNVDVVWRGDPVGPRVAQIGAMFETAAARNRGVIGGQTPVVLDVTLIRFHGVTERTRRSVGGVYNIIFSMTVRDARTGAVIEPPRRLVANLDAPGGSRGAQLEQSGQTEKVRVVDFLTTVLRAQLI
jgi:hypothetical protein